MSIWTTILDKLGLHKPAAAGGPGGESGSASKPPASMTAPKPGLFTPAPTPMAMVDVVSKLQKLAGDNPGLDWKVSIVDLLKLLGIDSSLNARKELAKELGCPADLMGGDSAKMNVWLHKTVLQKIADNGGNIPQNLLS
jgi:hypothetical protein